VDAQGLPEIFIDLNAAMPDGYRLTNGSIADLAALGLEPSQAVGKRFRFVAADEDEEGRPGDFYFDGVIVEDARYSGWLAVPDKTGVRWRTRN
jgi:hypothetical protein